VFLFRDAVKPSLAAAGETPVSHAPEKKQDDLLLWQLHLLKERLVARITADRVK
jgi:hypothetical protein